MNLTIQISSISDPLEGGFEFHISRQSRQKYDFDEAIYQLSGNAILANFGAARRFAQKINARHDLAAHPERGVRAGEINAMGLIDEILHLVLAQYKQQINPNVMAQAFAWIEERLGAQVVEGTLLQFADEFPPLRVYQREQALGDYFKGATAGAPNREILLEELLMLWLANANPAFDPYKELFDDRNLRQNTVYLEVIQEITTFFGYQPRFGPFNQTLVQMLRSPALDSPHSLAGQLAYIHRYWGGLLGETLLRLLSSLDFIKEEGKAFFGFGPGPVEPYDFRAHGLGDQPERFSPDRDWMGSLVLIAKNTYVWLDQLSRKYGREVSRLDHIPDEELDLLTRRGITGLWLIGLWQRSRASKRIKHIMGNPEAAASAYSLDDYVIAGDLGGEAAADDLRRRAWGRGIRLASDMVPNHMGIDSCWVLDHPDWFLGLDYSPFPAYRFNGENLSPRDSTGIFLEDRYYDHGDAAVVFKHVDYGSGRERYIYHGNDGTAMSWNDTAQLDFTQPEVREAVIQAILHVARGFPIIRFDAAMVLAKKHIQRLWFPVPGSGGAIPSRAEFGLSGSEFDRLMPEEFWREVVDRVAAEAPDTLLLAEAFWMMEGYFVRTLGMHRVYNSAFMHMLRDEDNAKYRQVIKNTIEFNPEILKRYVNFMNNPDEETAVEQFGKGDKYFGVATMMATLPGLPMVGHGQIEGFSEKYGMEYTRAKWEEQPDADLIARHERQVFPLFQRRRLFAEVENFLLYDFYTAKGVVDENVFAYSNRLGEARALVLYHNIYGDTRGWIKTSAAYLKPAQGGGERELIQTALGDGLALPDDPSAYTIFRELVSGQEYIRNCREVHQKGLFAELFAYQTLVFLDFRVVYDPIGDSYGRLAAELDGRGVPGIDEALREMALAPVLAPYGDLVNAGMFRYLIEHRLSGERKRVNPEPLRQAEEKFAALLAAVSQFAGQDYEQARPTKEARKRVERALQLPGLARVFPKPNSRNYRDLALWLAQGLGEGAFNWGVLLGWIGLDALGKLAGDAETPRIWMDEWLLRIPLAAMLTGLGADQGRADYGANLVRLLLAHAHWHRTEVGKRRKPFVIMEGWLDDPEVRSILGVNTFEGKTWFNLEAIGDWLWWMMAVAAVQILADPKVKIADKPDALLEAYAVVNKIRRTVPASGYEVETLLDLLNPGKKGS